MIRVLVGQGKNIRNVVGKISNIYNDFATICI